MKFLYSSLFGLFIGFLYSWVLVVGSGGMPIDPTFIDYLNALFTRDSLVIQYSIMGLVIGFFVTLVGDVVIKKIKKNKT